MRPNISAIEKRKRNIWRRHLKPVTLNFFVTLIRL